MTLENGNVVTVDEKLLFQLDSLVYLGKMGISFTATNFA